MKILSIPAFVLSFLTSVVAVLLGAVAIVVLLVGRLFGSIFSIFTGSRRRSILSRE